MKDRKKSFVLYTDYLEHIGLLGMEQRGILFTAILSYVNGISLPCMDSAVSMAFSFIKSTLDRDGEKYQAILEKRRLAGSIGGSARARNQSEANASFAKQTIANVADTDNNTGNDNEKDNVTENDTGNVIDTDTGFKKDTTPANCKAVHDISTLGPVHDSIHNATAKQSIEDTTDYANRCAERASPNIYHSKRTEKKALNAARLGTGRTDYNALIMEELLTALNTPPPDQDTSEAIAAETA